LLLSRGSVDHIGGEARRREQDRDLIDVHQLDRRLDRVQFRHADKAATRQNRMSRRREAGATLAGVEP
jgi:hypothetical protein